MSTFKKGYADAIKDVSNILKPLTESVAQYIEDNDVMAMVHDFRDFLLEIDILHGRNTQ